MAVPSLSRSCRDETIRGYSGVDLLVLDEAARVPDDVFFAVRPMLATSNGTIICMSTPNGPAGFLWEAATKFADVDVTEARKVILFAGIARQSCSSACGGYHGQCLMLPEPAHVGSHAYPVRD
jgi:hypothetical protein